MWALILVMILPTGKAIGEDAVRVYPSEVACIWAGEEHGPAFLEALAEKAKVPKESILPIRTCTKLAGSDV